MRTEGGTPVGIHVRPTAPGFVARLAHVGDRSPAITVERQALSALDACNLVLDLAGPGYVSEFRSIAHDFTEAHIGFRLFRRETGVLKPSTPTS